MGRDILHETKMQYNLSGCGTSEKLESVAKSITPALGLIEVSNVAQTLSVKLGAWLEFYGLANILIKKDVPFSVGLYKHMFFFDDSIVNAIIILGCGYVVISNFDLALPIAGIGAFYFGSDHFFKKVERL